MSDLKHKTKLHRWRSRIPPRSTKRKKREEKEASTVDEQKKGGKKTSERKKQPGFAVGGALSFSLMALKSSLLER